MNERTGQYPVVLLLELVRQDIVSVLILIIAAGNF